MLLIVGTVRIRAGMLDAARPIMASMVEASRAEPIPCPCRAGSVPSVARYQCGSLGWSASTAASSWRVFIMCLPTM